MISRPRIPTPESNPFNSEMRKLKPMEAKELKLHRNKLLEAGFEQKSFVSRASTFLILSPYLSSNEIMYLKYFANLIVLYRNVNYYSPTSFSYHYYYYFYYYYHYYYHHHYHYY